MKQMLDDLLTYSRAGRTAAPSHPVNLQAVVEEVCQNLGKLIADKGGRVEAHGLPTVFADRASLMQVLQNLIANGLKFCAPGRRPLVSVDCVEDASNWTISVADNGIGIEPSSSSAPSSFSSGCTGAISTKAAASGLPCARRSWNTTAAGSGSNRSRGRVRCSGSRCPSRHDLPNSFVVLSWWRNLRKRGLS